MAPKTKTFNGTCSGQPPSFQWSLQGQQASDDAADLVEALRKFHDFDDEIGEMGSRIKVTVERLP